MKKLILVFTAMVITAGAYAQTDSTNKNMTPPELQKTQRQNLQNNPPDQNNVQKQNSQNKKVDKSHPDGVMMQNGKMLLVKNGRTTNLSHDMTMSNGTKIMVDGTCIRSDGTKMKMKEGQHMDMSGNLIPMTTTNDKNMYLVPDNTKKQSN